MAALANPKIRAMVAGQQAAIEEVKQFRAGFSGEVIWFHCASLGEFEQGRPLMEALLQRKPDAKLAVSFYSPSGYEKRKGYDKAALLFYLPADTPANAEALIATLKPTSIFWIKYELWPNYLLTIKQNQIPAYLVSASLRPAHVQGIRGAFTKALLECFKIIFLQFEPGLKNLHKLGLQNGVVVGDTRFDNILALTAAKPDMPWLDDFMEGRKLVVLGSVWKEDMQRLWFWLNTFHERERDCILLAPHEMNEQWPKILEEHLPGFSLAYFSKVKHSIPANLDILVMDEVGNLSRIYSRAWVAWVGGGFKTGLHNILEPAGWGVPTAFGPKTHKFPEAAMLEKAKGAWHVTNEKTAAAIFEGLIRIKKDRDVAGLNARKFLEQNSGATTRILQHLGIA